MSNSVRQAWAPYLQRYGNGEWRAPIFRDMILSDARRLAKERKNLTFLDIGCGGGFDSEPELQQSIASFAGQYIGIEPDTEIKLGNIFSATHRCFFEEASIEPCSVDIAFSVMVLEHIEFPEKFWRKVHEVLRPGGIFWGFTVDARHWFVSASVMSEKLHIKDWYLDRLHGKRGEQRYENYGVYYRSNTPQQIEKVTEMFASRTILNFNREGQMDFYIPKNLRGIGRALDRFALRMGWPGNLLSVRVEK